MKKKIKEKWVGEIEKIEVYRLAGHQNKDYQDGWNDCANPILEKIIQLKSKIAK